MHCNPLLCLWALLLPMSHASTRFYCRRCSEFLFGRFHNLRWVTWIVGSFQLHFFVLICFGSICTLLGHFWVEKVIHDFQPPLDQVFVWQLPILENELLYFDAFFGQLISGVSRLARFNHQCHIVLFQVFDAGAHRLLVGCAHYQKMIVFEIDLRWLIVHCLSCRLYFLFFYNQKLF